MQNIIDYRFAIELLIPTAEYGWLAPAEQSKTDTLGQYEWIDWRDTRKKPSQKELETAWNNYIATNGTPEEQQSTKKAQKDAALARLKLSHNAEVLDLLKLLT